MLITSAGMVQFKPYFLQQKQLEAPHIGTTTVQKCVRTTDIDIIGITGRHLSFFEMLGNFSFGEYFKKEMCAWAYEFSTEVLGFDPDRLYFTVYLDDDETIEIWKSLGVPENHITRLGEKDNFWMAGPTGPCGPCSELYFDQGSEFGCDNPNCAPGCDCERYLEYWNCVFTQYDRQEDGTLLPLPKKNIDTGMGLERTAAILQKVKSNYETDILRGLIAVGERLSSASYGTDRKTDISLRICADHARAVTFMIADGILPSNEGRGYVLRRLLRRAVLHGQLLGMESPFLNDYVGVVINEMGSAYPELIENRSLVKRIVSAEEERFNQTLRQGLSFLNARITELVQSSTKNLASLRGAMEKAMAHRESMQEFRSQIATADEAELRELLRRTDGFPAIGELLHIILPGKTVFELHDRYGFPIDLTTEIAAQQGVEIDRAGFEHYMHEQRERARAAVKDDAWGTIGGVYNSILASNGATCFVGYDNESTEATVIAIVVQGQAADGSDEESLLVESINNGQKAQIVLDKTPFYGEMGGQVGDTGELVSVHASFRVTETKVYDGEVFAHVGQLRGQGRLAVGDMVNAQIDSTRRRRIERNHTATHLLHHALRKILGDHVKQAGSLVSPDRLRFDFTHFEALSSCQIAEIEELVNTLIMEDSPVFASETTLEQARERGVTALFGEKYGDVVRVLEACPDSQELCGGTHVKHSSQIGFFKILSESSVGANLRRIEAVTGSNALQFVNQLQFDLISAAALLKAQPQELTDRLEALLKRTHELEAELSKLHRSGSAEHVNRIVDDVIGAGYSLVVARVDGLAVDGMRELWDMLHTRLGGHSAAVLGGLTPENTPLLIAAATQEAVQAGFDANAVIKQIAPCIKGGGGGKATMAQAGGRDVSGLDAALEKAREILSPS